MGLKYVIIIHLPYFLVFGQNRLNTKRATVETYSDENLQ